MICVFASHAVEASLSAESLAFDTGADGPGQAYPLYRRSRVGASGIEFSWSTLSVAPVMYKF